MQQDYPLPNLAAPVSSAEKVLHLTEQLASKEEMLLITNLEGNVLAANDMARNTLFRGNPDFLFSQILDLVDEEFRPMAPKHLALLEEKRQLQGYVMVNVPETGPELLSFKSSLLHNDDNCLLYISAKFAATEIKEDGGKKDPVVSYNSVLKDTSEPFFIINSKGIILDVNPSALDWIGQQKDDLTGKSLAKAFELNPSEKSALLKTIDKVADKGPQKFDWWIRTKEHSYLPVEVTLHPGRYLGKPVVVGTAREKSDNPETSSGRAGSLGFVNSLVASIGDLTDEVEMMQETLRQLIQYTSVTAGAIYQLGEGQQVARLVSTEKIKRELLVGHQEIPIDKKLIQQLTGPVSRPIRYTLSRSFQHRFGRKELLAMPVCCFKELTGIIVLFVEDFRQITPSLTTLIDFVGNEIGNAINRINLTRELSQSEKKYRTLFESSHDALFLSSLDEILDCNSKAQELLGTAKENIIGSKAHVFSSEYQPDGQLSNEKAYQLLLHTLETGESQTFEWVTRRSDGSLFESEISIDRVMLDGSYYLQTVVRDVTQRKQVETALRSKEVLRESMGHFRNFLGKVNLPYMSQDLDGNITFVNDYFVKYTGYKRKELIGQNFFSLLTQEDQREERLASYRELVRTGQVSDQYEREIITKAGDSKIVRWSSTFELDNNGKVIGVISVGKDLTDKRIALEALKDNKVRLQDIFDNAHDLIQNISVDNKFIFVNKAWKEKLGYTDADIEKLTLNDIVHPYYKAKLIYQLRNLYKGEKVNKIETVFMTKAGKPVHLIGSISCSFQNNKAVATRAILHDITDRIKAERLQKVYYSIANLAISSKDLPSLYSAIHRELSKIIETNNIYIALCNEEKTELTFVYYVDQFIGKNTNLKTRPFSKGISEYVIKTGMPLFMGEKDVQQLIQGGKVKPIGNQPKVMLCSPLAVGERIIGMIAVQDYKKEDAYVSTDIEILHFISNQIALAIERKRNEEQINKQNARFKAIFESGSHMMWSVGRDLLLTSCNQNYYHAFFELNGYYPQLNQTSLNAGGQPSISPDQQNMWLERLQHANEGEDQHFEIKLQSPKGDEVWHEIFLNPIYLEDGSFEEVSGISLDITDKKKSQLAMAVSEEKFRRIFESFQDVFYRADQEGNMTLMSPSVQDLLGYTSEECIGMHGSKFYENPEDRLQLIEKIQAQGQVRNFETSLRCKDGTIKQVLVNSRLIRDQNGYPIGMEGVVRDIMELKQTQNELIQAKEMAENLLQVKDQFLANMSHELRTPMNGIIGMVDLLYHSNNTPEQKEFIDTLRRSSDALLNILNDILDLSKIGAGKMEVRLAPVDLHDTLAENHSLFANRAQQKDLQFSFTIAPEVPRYVITDGTRLHQVLSNLTSNAIKFTNRGEVSINVGAKKAGEDTFLLEFRVKDTGIGITEDDIKRLFNEFTQLDNSSTKTFGGTGLGLAISKQISELLGGKIGVDSVCGQGSTFWFTISCLEAEPFVPKPEPKELEVEKFQNPPYVLLVDDNLINQKVAVKLLERIGCKADVASNGYEAIHQAELNEYDLIFMDIQMPEMDGVTATRHIKEMLGENAPPIVAMTAYSMKDDASKFMNQGLDDYVPKPIRSKDLYSMIKHWHEEGHVNPLVDVPEEKTENDLIDDVVVEQLLGMGGMDFAAQLYAEFEEETEPLLEEAKKAVDSHDYKSILSTLHQIKGTSSTLGLHSIAELAKKLEHNIKHEDFSSVAHDFVLFRNQFNLYKKVYPNKFILS